MFSSQSFLDSTEVFEGWAINLSTNAISRYTGYNFNSFGGNLGANSQGIFELTGTTDNGLPINSYVETGKLDFGSSYMKRATDFYMGVDGGVTHLTATTEGSSAKYRLAQTTQLANVKADMARGAKGRYWTFKLENVEGSVAKVHDMEVVVKQLSRRVRG
jgi:hypothetical protein